MQASFLPFVINYMLYLCWFMSLLQNCLQLLKLLLTNYVLSIVVFAYQAVWYLNLYLLGSIDRFYGWVDSLQQSLKINLYNWRRFLLENPVDVRRRTYPYSLTQVSDSADFVVWQRSFRGHQFLTRFVLVVGMVNKNMLIGPRYEYLRVFQDNTMFSFVWHVEGGESTLK